MTDKFSIRAPQLITGVIGAAFLFLGSYFLVTGISAYQSERESLFSFLFRDVPNWQIVKGAFFLGLALGVGVAEIFLIGTSPKSGN